MDEQSEKAEEELTASIINHFKILDSKKTPAINPKVAELKKRKTELEASNQLKNTQIEQEKQRNITIKQELQALNSEKKVYTEKAEQVKKLQEEVN